ncbi:MAG TPA: AAA family ATPase [Mycobacteriales bacterium]|nr:AAA family ATPase [Mycobacteriales bacterium]
MTRGTSARNATPMRKILVGGSSGAGKSTMARALASRLEIPYVEVDSLFHGPNWTPREDFRADLDAFTSQPAWIIDHDYGVARDLVWPRLDTFLWLDYSRLVCEWRVIRRSVPRAVMRKELWNGNREPLLGMFTDAEHPVRWSWTHHAGKRAGFEQRIADPANNHVSVVRLRRPSDARNWLATVPR